MSGTGRAHSGASTWSERGHLPHTCMPKRGCSAVRASWRLASDHSVYGATHWVCAHALAPLAPAAKGRTTRLLSHSVADLKAHVAHPAAALLARAHACCERTQRRWMHAPSMRARSGSASAAADRSAARVSRCAAMPQRGGSRARSISAERRPSRPLQTLGLGFRGRPEYGAQCWREIRRLYFSTLLDPPTTTLTQHCAAAAGVGSFRPAEAT